MKKTIRLIMPLLMLIILLAHLNTSLGFSLAKPNANDILPYENLYGKYINASEFVKLSVKEFSLLTGEKLNFIQRLSFRVAKLRMRHDLKKNSNLKITDYIDKQGEGKSFDIGWFLLGLAGPLIGVVIGAVIVSIIPFIILAIAPLVTVYATKQNKTAKKSAWIGFGSAIILLIIFGLIVAANLSFY